MNKVWLFTGLTLIALSLASPFIPFLSVTVGGKTFPSYKDAAEYYGWYDETLTVKIYVQRADGSYGAWGSGTCKLVGKDFDGSTIFTKSVTINPSGTTVTVPYAPYVSCSYGGKTITRGRILGGGGTLTFRFRESSSGESTPEPTSTPPSWWWPTPTPTATPSVEPSPTPESAPPSEESPTFISDAVRAWLLIAGATMMLFGLVKNE